MTHGPDPRYWTQLNALARELTDVLVNARADAPDGLVGQTPDLERLVDELAHWYRHGLWSSYVLGCRCEPCTTAATSERQGKFKRQNDESRKNANRSRLPWTEEEIRLIRDDSIAASVIAERFGRSVKAVKSARYSYRRRSTARRRADTIDKEIE